MKKFLKKVGSISMIMLMIICVVTGCGSTATKKVNKEKTEEKEEVRINNEQANLYVGETITLKISGTKETVTWNSKDSQIADVDTNGVVTAKSVGDTIIIATVNNSEYSCKVNVTEPYLNSEKLTLSADQTFQLEMNGAKVTEWKSEDSSIVSVDENGCLQAVKDGTTKVVCTTDDGKTYSCELVVDNNHTHNYTSEITKESTCSDSGIMTYSCECGSKYTENIKKLDHKYKLEKTVEATCEKTGYKEYKCEKCSNSYKESIAKLKHDYKLTKTVKATCENAGYKQYKCKTCDNSYKEEIKKLEHDYKLTKTEKATCENAGYKEYKCSNCNNSYKESIAKLKHNYKLIKTVNATETSEGYKEYKCSNCNDTYKETIAKLQHTHNYKLVKTVNATCKGAGYKEYKCEKCSNSYKETIAKLEHNYKLTSSTASTCSTNGQEVYTCSNCQDSYTKTLPLDTSKHNYTQTSSDLMYRYLSCKCGKSYKEYNDQEYTIDLGNGNTTTVVGHYDLEMANRIGELVNEKRVNIGKNPFTISSLNSNANNAALIRAREIKIQYSHTRPNGENGVVSFASYAAIRAENVGKGHSTADAFFNGFENSSQHAIQHISSQYANISIAVFASRRNSGGYYYYCVELFG